MPGVEAMEEAAPFVLMQVPVGALCASCGLWVSSNCAAWRGGGGV